METDREKAQRETALRDYAKYGLFQSLPDHRQNFAQDLTSNYKHIATNFKKGTISDVLIMSENYAVQMALEYKKKVKILPESIVDSIINQVGDALNMILDDVATKKFLEDLEKRTKNKLSRSDINEYIDRYWDEFGTIDRHI